MLLQIFLPGIVKSQGPWDEYDPGLNCAADTVATDVELTGGNLGDPIVRRGNIEHTDDDAAQARTLSAVAVR